MLCTAPANACTYKMLITKNGPTPDYSRVDPFYSNQTVRTAISVFRRLMGDGRVVGLRQMDDQPNDPCRYRQSYRHHGERRRHGCHGRHHGIHHGRLTRHRVSHREHCRRVSHRSREPQEPEVERSGRQALLEEGCSGEHPCKYHRGLHDEEDLRGDDDGYVESE